MKFLWFLFFYPLNLFKPVNKSELNIYLTFQKIVRMIYVVALIFESVLGLFLIYPKIIDLYNASGLPIPSYLQMYPSIALASIILTLIFAIYVLINLNKTRINVERLNEQELVRLHDVSYSKLDLFILLVLVLLTYLTANLSVLPYGIMY